MSMQGIKFNDIHSYYDLNLILSQCSISPAEPKTNYIEIPGADGSLDLSEALGEIKYKDRKGTLVFSVLPDAGDFEEIKSKISNLLNGVYFEKITLDKDPDFYYQGRCSVNDWKCDKRIGQITVDLKLNPWKTKTELTVIDASSMTQTVNLFNAGKPVVPYVDLLAPATIEFDGNLWELSEGMYTVPDFILKTGDNLVFVDAPGHCKFVYQERGL